VTVKISVFRHVSYDAEEPWVRAQTWMTYVPVVVGVHRSWLLAP
jgi:hypothetical protein